MKKELIILSMLLVVGCAQIDIFNSIPPKTIDNPKCENIKIMEVYKVEDDFALAHRCEPNEFTEKLECYKNSLYIPKKKGDLYYNGQRIEIEEDKCIILTTTHRFKGKNYKNIYYKSGRKKYTVVENIDNTIPEIKIIDKQIENPDYVEYMKKNKN